MAIAMAFALACSSAGALGAIPAHAAPLEAAETISVESDESTAEAPLTLQREFNQNRQDYLAYSSTVLNGSNLHVNARGKLERVSSSFGSQAYSPRLIVEEVADDLTHPAWRKEIPNSEYWPGDLKEDER